MGLIAAINTAGGAIIVADDRAVIHMDKSTRYLTCVDNIIASKDSPNIILITGDYYLKDTEYTLYDYIKNITADYINGNVCNLAAKLLHEFGPENNINAQIIIAGRVGVLPYIYKLDTQRHQITEHLCGLNEYGLISAGDDTILRECFKDVDLSDLRLRDALDLTQSCFEFISDLYIYKNNQTIGGNIKIHTF